MASRRTVVERPLARLDIADQYNYLLDASEQAAEKFLAALHETYERLLDAPESGRLVELTTRFEGLRVRPLHLFDSLLVFYVARASGIDVVRVLHGARDIPEALDFM